jgi:hypothetical protein
MSRYVQGDDANGRPSSSGLTSGRPSNSSPRRNRKRLILSQSMVIDVDSSKVRSRYLLTRIVILQHTGT